MAKLTAHPKIELRINFSVTEEEARALDAMVGYGYDSFITTFKKHMGEAYMCGHEDGLKQFFDSVRLFLPAYLHRADDARNVFTGQRAVAYIPKLPVGSIPAKEIAID